MKVYMLYAKIQETLWNEKLQFLVFHPEYYKWSEELNSYVGLYGWSDDQEMIKRFIESRKTAAKSFYTVITHKMDKGEYLIFRKEHIMEEIGYYIIPKSNNESLRDYEMSKFLDTRLSIKDMDSNAKLLYSHDELFPIVCTKEEYNEAFSNGSAFMYEFLIRTMEIDYNIFNDDVIQALDMLGYCKEYDTMQYQVGPTDDDDYDPDERFESVYYNRSFGLSPLGNYNTIDLYNNKAGIFFNLYYEMIVGYQEGGKIRLVN